MNCYKHSDQAAVAYCRKCGKALCQTCQRAAQGTVFCEEHVPAPEPGPAPAVPPYQPGASSPGLAFLLGLIPGVGAIYNAQYVKGLVHVIIFGMLISIVSSSAAGDFEPLFGMLIAIWYLYMPFEAYHTASKRQRGEPVDEFSSLVSVNTRPGNFPTGPVVIIAIGVIFLLNTLGVVHLYQILRYWPVFLIVLGTYMLYSRLTADGRRADVNREVHHEQQ